ncbi:hypothetical protein QTN25_002930 [Entamoeba marina]
MIFLFLFTLVYCLRAYWTQDGDYIQITSDSNVYQPGWEVITDDSNYDFIFKTNCSSHLTIGPNTGSVFYTKSMRVESNSPLIQLFFSETLSIAKLVAITQNMVNGFLLGFNGSRKMPNADYETEIYLYSRSLTIQTLNNSERLILYYKYNSNSYLLFNTTVENYIDVDI